MKSKKTRRNSGRVTTKIYKPKELPYEETYWDDWIDHRDGMRGNLDRKAIVNEHNQLADYFDIKKYNKKNKKLLKRRKARQQKS